jgi:hypothetical protein
MNHEIEYRTVIRLSLSDDDFGRLMMMVNHWADCHTVKDSSDRVETLPLLDQFYDIHNDLIRGKVSVERGPALLHDKPNRTVQTSDDPQFMWTERDES